MLYLDIEVTVYIAWWEADSKCLRAKIVITKKYSVTNLSKHMRINAEAKNGDRKAGNMIDICRMIYSWKYSTNQ